MSVRRRNESTHLGRSAACAFASNSARTRPCRAGIGDVLLRRNVVRRAHTRRCLWRGCPRARLRSGMAAGRETVAVRVFVCRAREVGLGRPVFLFLLGSRCKWQRPRDMVQRTCRSVSRRPRCTVRAREVSLVSAGISAGPEPSNAAEHGRSAVSYAAETMEGVLVSVPAARLGCRTRDGGGTRACSRSGRTTAASTDRFSFFFSDRAENGRASERWFDEPAV